jgi:hypothetical protein
MVVSGTTPSLNGITFPATQVASADANTLDDYEEGTWTPTLSGGFSSGPSGYTTQAGGYTKIGNVVYFSLFLNADGATANASGIFISGLPFTAASSAGYRSGAVINYQINFNTNAADSYGIDPGGTRIGVYDAAGNERLGNASGVLINNLVQMYGFYFV